MKLDILGKGIGLYQLKDRGNQPNQLGLIHINNAERKGDIQGHEEEGNESPSVWGGIYGHLQKITAPSIDCKTNNLQMEGLQHDSISA